MQDVAKKAIESPWHSLGNNRALGALEIDRCHLGTKRTLEMWPRDNEI